MTADKRLEERLREAETRLRDTEVQLRQSLERLQVLLEFSSDWYWEQDANFRFTVLTRNSAYPSRILALDVIGKTRWELPYVGKTKEQWAEHKALLEAHQPFKDFVLKRYDLNGNFGCNSISGEPVFDSEGDFKGYRGITKDITERTRAYQREAMEHAVTRLLSQSNDPAEAIPKIIQTICETLECACGAYWSVDRQSEQLRQAHTWHIPSSDVAAFLDSSRYFAANLGNMRLAEQGGIIRRTWVEHEPVWKTDVVADPTFRRGAAAKKAGLQTAFGVPVMANERALGVLEFFDREIRQPDEKLLQSLRTIGRQVGLFYQRKNIEARQAMEHMVTRLLAECSSTTEAIPRIIQTICETLGWDYGGYWSMDQGTETVRCVATWTSALLDAEDFLSATEKRSFQLEDIKALPTQGHIHRVWNSAEPVWVEDIGDENYTRRTPFAARAGLRSVFAFPVLAGQEVIGVIEFFSYNIRQPDEVLVETACLIGIQIGQFCQRKIAEERIQYLAYYDGLTGLPNRSLFSQRLNHAVATARRNSKHLAVLFIDLDRFKNINDTLGHEAGDYLLKDMATRFRACLRESDTVARLGGDEFIVLLEDITDPKHAANVALKINNCALSPFLICEREYHISASVGISIYPEDGDDEQTLMKHADIAMFQAKDHGKNNYRFYSTKINAHSFERLALESSLRHALERNELLLHYQAKVDLQTGQVTGMEALLRWNHPELGMVSPSRFIPLAEETGLIVPIGRWVIDTACMQNKAWEAQGFPPLCISVNLSARQFNDEGLMTDILDALQKSGLAPNLLQLEITESMVMHNPDKAVELLSEMRAIGISIAMDDFGMGYSCLSQLKRLPINALKIDGSFIKELETSKEDAAITGAIIAMGKTLNLDVIAEGVETIEQVNFLRSHHCTEIQGFYFSRPIPANEFADLLRTGKTLKWEDSLRLTCLNA